MRPDDITTGVSDRTASAEPVPHLIINVGTTYGEDWRLLCSGWPGFPAWEHDGPLNSKLCDKCQKAAWAMVDNGELTAAQVNDSAVTDPLDPEGTGRRAWVRA